MNSPFKIERQTFLKRNVSLSAGRAGRDGQSSAILNILFKNCGQSDCNMKVIIYVSGVMDINPDKRAKRALIDLGIGCGNTLEIDICRTVKRIYALFFHCYIL